MSAKSSDERHPREAYSLEFLPHAPHSSRCGLVLFDPKDELDGLGQMGCLLLLDLPDRALHGCGSMVGTNRAAALHLQPKQLTQFP